MRASYSMDRLGTVMSPVDHPTEAWGVLNPASARDRAGELFLFPRLVAEGNYSRVGKARVLFDDEGVPTGAERQGIAFEPEEVWERNARTAGTEDPRITFVPRLDAYVMTYTAYGPLGAKVALAVSEDLEIWRRLGPVTYAYQPGLRTDLNLYPNKDAVLFPDPVPDPEGNLAYALLHRPMWDLAWIRPQEGEVPPPGLPDDRPGIWVSFAPVEEVDRDIRRLAHLDQHRAVAFPEQHWEALKIGGGTPPVRVDEGWLTIHHGVTGRMVEDTDLQPHVRYCAGYLILDPEDVSQVLHRSEEPLLEPEVEEERDGTVPNVVFPTAIEPHDGDSAWVYYGMADSRIGLARLNRHPW